jgi:general secretion pathway protein F
MPAFTYRTVDRSLNPSRGTITAETSRQARDELRSRGLIVEELNLQSSPTTSAHSWLHHPRRYEAKLVPIIRELATLTSAAIPLDEALATVASRPARALFMPM